jgi:Glycosyl hydrolase catalytic core
MLVLLAAASSFLVLYPFPSSSSGNMPPLPWRASPSGSGASPFPGSASPSSVGNLSPQVTEKHAPGYGPCTASSPYGFTTIHSDAQLVAEYRQLHVCWLRYQLPEDAVEIAPQVYDWHQLDAVVAAMNVAGVHLDFPLECFRSSGYACFTHPYEPSSTEMAAFAGQLAMRYDGKHGHGIIDAFEIGNEEYDFYPPSSYGPILQAGYQAIKAVYPQALVGMYGTFSSSLVQTHNLFTTLFAAGYGQYMDFMNLHYYNGGADPAQTRGDHPSFDLRWQTMQAIAARYGFAGKPIWVTEVGWTTSPLPGRLAVSPQVQAQYLTYVTAEAAHSRVIKRVFWFTINYGNQGDSIYPASGPLPAFYALQQFVQQNQRW